MMKEIEQQVKTETTEEIKIEVSNKAKNPVQPKVTSKVQPKVSVFKNKMTLDERYDDVKKKLNAYEVLVDAYPFNSCFANTRNCLQIKLEKLEKKKNRKNRV